MKSVFVELPAFERHRANYKDVADDLTKDQKTALARLLKQELVARRDDET